MALNQQFSVQVVFAIALTIGVSLCVDAQETTVTTADDPANAISWGTVTAAGPGSISVGTLDTVTAAFPSTFSAKDAYGSNPIVLYKTKMAGNVVLTDAGSGSPSFLSYPIIFALDVKYAAFTGVNSEFAIAVNTNSSFSSTLTSVVCNGNSEVKTPLGASITNDNIFHNSCTSSKSNNSNVTITQGTIFEIYFSGSAGGFYPQCGMTFDAGVTYQNDGNLTIANNEVTSFSGNGETYNCGCDVTDSVLLNGRTLTMELDVTFAVSIPYIVFYFTDNGSDATDAKWKDNADFSPVASFVGSPGGMDKNVSSYVGIDASSMSPGSGVEFIIDDFPSDKFSTGSVKCYAYHTASLVAASETVAANFVQGDTARSFNIGAAKSFSNTGLEVKWGETTDVNTDNFDGTTESMSDKFPSSFALSGSASKFETVESMVAKPFLRFKFTSDIVADLKNATETDVAYSLYFTGGYAKIGTYFMIVHADGEDGKVVDGGTSLDIAGLGAQDGSFYKEFIVGGAGTATGAAKENVFVFYLTGEASVFYQQCGMEVKGLVETDALASASVPSGSADFADATSEMFDCGCTINTSEGVSYSSEDLIIDAVLFADAGKTVVPPYVVFELAKDAAGVMLYDSTDDDASTHAATWGAISGMKAMFSTDASDETAVGAKVDATIPTIADDATPASTIVQIVTDGTDDVALNGTIEKPVVFTIEDFKSDYCLGETEVFVNCFLYHTAATNVAVGATVAANYVKKSTPQKFTCSGGSDENGAENSIGFSIFLMVLTVFAMEL